MANLKPTLAKLHVAACVAESVRWGRGWIRLDGDEHDLQDSVTVDLGLELSGLVCVLQMMDQVRAWGI